MRIAESRIIPYKQTIPKMVTSIPHPTEATLTMDNGSSVPGNKEY